MLYIILLLILAVLLFGSAAVLAAIGQALSFVGAMLAFIVAMLALFWFSNAVGVDPITVLIIGVLGFFALCGLTVLVAKLLQPWELKRKREADLKAQIEAETQEVVAKSNTITIKHAPMSRDIVAEVRKIMARDNCSMADALQLLRYGQDGSSD